MRLFNTDFHFGIHRLDFFTLFSLILLFASPLRAFNTKRGQLTKFPTIVHKSISTKYPQLSKLVFDKSNHNFLPLNAENKLQNDVDINRSDQLYSTDILKTLQWVISAAGFSLLIANFKGTDSAIEFLSGYFLEQSLSVDNLFVFILLFKYFGIERKNEAKILNYGIIGGNNNCFIIILYFYLNITIIYISDDSKRNICIHWFCSNISISSATIRLWINTLRRILWYTF